MEWLFYIVQATLWVCSATILLRIATVIWWKPVQLKRFFESQGIRGPPYRLVCGNAPKMAQMMAQAKSTPMPLSHDIIARVLPHDYVWTKTYGKDIVHWFGTKPRLNVHNPELIHEILSNKSGHYDSPPLDPFSNQVARQGILGLKGEKWTQHRRTIAPAFHLDPLKAMVPTIVKSTTTMLEEWSELVLSGKKEVDVFEEFRKLTGDAIARIAFGSNYVEGNHIFNMQAEQMVLTTKVLISFYIPGFRFVPTRENMKLWKLKKEIRRAMIEVIKRRERSVVIEKSGSYGNDLLGLMMSPKKQRVGGKLQDVCMTNEELVDECKTMYLAGHAATSNLLAWAMLLLGMNQEWQERARNEVFEVFGKDVYPDADNLNRLKIVGMIINETLRLYPPAVGTLRQAVKPVKLGKLSIPGGTELFIPILGMHHDPALWGNDANEFNPGRFSEGIAKAAKHPFAFLPFGSGPRICVGQNFALMEAKVVLAMVLQRFSFVISPSYAHAPAFAFTLQPQHGVQVILQMM